MKKWIIIIFIIILLPSIALAGGSRKYIIPDSDTRILNEAELWEWDYESLGYILNEIFARHGYNFIAGEKYDAYFSRLSWYVPNADSDNARACYPKLSSLEWDNERLIKEVMEDMRTMGLSNQEGKNYREYISFDSIVALLGFEVKNLKTGQMLSVYSAPSTSSYRGANGKAVVSTNGDVYVAGWDQGWLLLMYETNNGAVRVGYVNGIDIQGSVNAPNMSFSYITITLSKSATLTDDPVTGSSNLASLKANQQVTYLATFYSQSTWLYVETLING